MTPSLMLLLLCGIYHGPGCKWFVKHGISDFGDFIVILLILSKVQAANGFTVFPDRFPPESVTKIETFLQIFPLLTARQKDILAKFISYDDIDAFLREHFCEHWMEIFHKYHDTFCVILPMLFENGLTVSPNYRGRYACSTAKWVVAKTIFSFMEQHTSRPLDDPTATLVSQTTSHAITIMQNLGNNLIFKLYIETMFHMELTNDPKCFDIASRHFRDILDKNQSHYEGWLKFIAEFRRRTHIQIGEFPKDWDSGFICWLMNWLQSYEFLSEYMAKNLRKN